MNYCGLSQGPQHKVEMIGRYNQMERPATILKHLKEIEVKCDVVNEQVHKVLKFLGTFGIRKRTSKTHFAKSSHYFLYDVVFSNFVLVYQCLS
jgi:hypothetical protein